MADVAIGDGKWMYVPAGQVAADVATYAALHTDVGQASAPVNKLWLPLAQGAAFMVLPGMVMQVIPEMTYARAVFCAIAICGGASTSGGAVKIIDAELNIQINS
jgi:hypothetical protein